MVRQWTFGGVPTERAPVVRPTDYQGSSRLSPPYKHSQRSSSSLRPALRYSDELPVDVEPYASPLAADPRERRDEQANFLLLAAHQVLLRVGWIFKTESIVMPVFMDYVGGGPVMRAMLMVLSRLGFSVPPVMFSRQLKIASKKKWLLASCSLAMSVPFGLLAALCWSGAGRNASGGPTWWMPAAFLFLYGVFFALTGMNQLAAHALQGKVVRATLRGRLFTVSVVVGAPLAIGAAWYAMPSWLAEPDTGFALLFASSAAAFALAGGVTLAMREESDDFEQQRSPVWEYFQHAWQVIERDSAARSLALLTVLFSATFMLFPHYVAVANAGQEFDLGRMTVWVCVQNAGTAALSLVVGPLADRLGNRAALHLTTAGVALAPLMAVLGLMGPESIRTDHSWLMFIAIGFTPVSIRLLLNYALEIAPRDDHPKYISALGLCMAVPVVVGAPLVGWIAGAVGYLPVFGVGFLVLLASVVQTFRIPEPRHGDTTLAIKALEQRA